MPDYGHPLRFGVFLTPAAADPDTTVSLAVHAEQAGLDLVTFQDHPYQPAFLDTWVCSAGSPPAPRASTSLGPS